MAVSITRASVEPGVEVDVAAKAFSALGDPVRLRILELLLERGELTVGQLTELVPVTQPRVSVHLRCLTNCGFAAVRREGRNAFYCVSGPYVSAVLAVMKQHAADNRDSIRACLPCAPGERRSSSC